MKINLYDIEKKIDVEINLKPDYSVTVNDLYVVFANNNAVCNLPNGKDSKPYKDYLIRKISHIVGGNILNNDYDCYLTIGFYASDKSIIPFMINQTDSDGYDIFKNPQYFEDDNVFDDLFIFNYNEYSLLIKLGVLKLTEKDYLIRLINNKNDTFSIKLYNTPNIIKDELTNIEGFNKFIDEEGLI